MESLSWIQDGEMVALGWTLLHFCWQGALIALLYVAADRITLHARAAVRYGVALAALALMPLAALATFIDQASLVVRLPRGGHEIVASQLGAMHTALIRDIPMAAPALVNSELWIAGNTSHLLPWIDSVWLVGVLLLALRALGGWWQLEHLRRRAKASIPPAVEASFQHVSKQLRLGRTVALRISDEVISPLAMGIWHAAVILPASAILQLEPAQLEAVLAHELAHIRRLDFLCNLLQTTVECLLFFHPAVWWISHRTRDLREICCDEVAARSCEDPVIYAEALLQLEETRTKHLQLAMALKGRNGSLLIRVRQILGEGITMERTTTSGLRVIVLGAVVLGVFFGSRAANGLRLTHFDAARHALRQIVAPVAPTPATAPVVATASLHRPAAPSPVGAAAAPTVAAEPAVEAAQAEPAPHDSGEIKGSGLQYIQQMRDAGYPLDMNKDLDEIISLRSLGVTPEFAKAMAQLGMGTPTLRELTSLKAVGVTPDYIASLRSAGITPKDFREVISDRAVGVTPEYAKSIAALDMGTPDSHELASLRAQGVTPEYAVELKAAGMPAKDLHELASMRALGVTPEYAKSIAAIGMGTPSTHELISLRAQGVTPEYAAQLKSAGMPAKDLHQLASMRSLGVTPEYASSMAAAGFPGLTTQDLIEFRSQGITPEYVRWFRQTFPSADSHALRQAAVFQINAEFIDEAKSHGFTDASLDKLVKIKMSGLLD
jgi:beta-lactamase regulating signal transducer with metallopeptidase domain